MTPEQKLELFLAADAPERDVAFCAGVMERVARRRAWLTLAAATPWALVATVLLWALHPVLGAMVEPLAAGASGAAVILLMTATGLMGARLAVRELRRR